MKAADVRAMTLDQIDDEVLKLKTIATQKRSGQEPAVKAESASVPAPEKKAKTAKLRAAARPKTASRAKSKSKK